MILKRLRVSARTDLFGKVRCNQDPFMAEMHNLTE